MNISELDEFYERLGALHEFPCSYPFSFIVPPEQKKAVQALFPESKISIRKSKTGKYISIRSEIIAQSVNEIRAIYEKACTIKGLIAL